MTSAPRQLDCFTIALGKKTGTTFPITFDNKHNYNALYDTGTGASLINYSAYVSLGQDLDTGYQPFMKNASGEDMGALGQVTCTFTINDQPFTQSFIVCRHMQRPVILGTDFTSMNFVGIIWTREGTRKMIRSNGSTVMELPDTTSGVPLVLARSVKIRPGGNLEVPLECTRQLTDQMDIRIDTGFHHKNPNIYIPPCCINNPNNKHNPRYMPLTIFNRSTVDHLYIRKDTMIAFAEQPVLETYNIELASEDKIEEHLAKPQNWVPQKHETLPEIPHDTAFLCSPADMPGPRKVQLQDKDITTDIRQKFEELCDEYGEAFSKNNEDIGRTKLVKMDIDTGDSSLILRTAHDDLGHNGFPKTYAAIKRVFFWKGMKEDIRKYCKTCATCKLHKLENVKFERKIFKPSLQPMDFICMDLIGEFHPPTSHGHHYALTAVCMLTGFTWCVPLKTKTAEEVSKAYMDHIYCNFGGSIKILTDNGTEFKNKLFKEVVSKLGTEFSIHSPPYRPQSNGKIKGFHRFLKTCIGKHINYGLEWDELTPMATACYNFFPNCSARESAFFIMFGRDPINKLNMLLHAARHYFHDDNGLPNLEVLKNIYQVVAQQLLNSRERYVKKHHNQQ